MRMRGALKARMSDIGPEVLWTWLVDHDQNVLARNGVVDNVRGNGPQRRPEVVEHALRENPIGDLREVVPEEICGGR